MKGEQMSIRHTIHKVDKISFEYFNLTHSVGMDIKIVTENDEKFSKKLSQLGDIYINDAFSCSHRKQSSVHKIVNFFDAFYGGPLLEKQIGAINLIINEKKSPVTCIIGGSKISTKINIILNLIKNVDNVIIVGAMANSFLYIKGYNIRISFFDAKLFCVCTVSSFFI